MITMDFHGRVLTMLATLLTLCAAISSSSSDHTSDLLSTNSLLLPQDQGPGGDHQGDDQHSFLRSSEEVKWLYEEWLVTHAKSYDMERFEIFQNNLRFIDEHNSRPELHNRSSNYVLGLNRFADLTNEEFASLYLSSNYAYNNMSDQEQYYSTLPVSDRYVYKYGDELPGCVDWRAAGAVGPVKDQCRCKSCWAFAAVAAIEGINYIISGQTITLSEQQILDCEMLGLGCGKSGHAQDAYEFVVMNGGISADESYPYRKRKEKCKWNSDIVVSIAQYEFIPRNSEMCLQKAVASQPISVVVGSHCRAFQFYKSGIFDGPCGDKMRHNMVVVGYDSEDGKDYWIVKNSWGAEWGEAGYIRIERNVEDPAGKCGITTYASYPIMCPSYP